MADSVPMRIIRNASRPSTPVLVIIKVLVCIIPLAQIIMGAVHLDDCPRQHYIPIYLIVVGIFAIMLVACVCLPCAREPKDGPPNPFCRISLGWNALLAVFLVAWFIAGNVWIYSIYKPNYYKNVTSAEPYCDKILYLFAFWTTTLIYCTSWWFCSWSSAS
ncbi:transmembrane protein 272-like [Hippocampus zosterae]|uniref:transmembrane protein 272-like n=1 Tax=Hippocampus zosterae TaxID=109293 RepID=UPI00223E369C|nr:transmembrane protein 272-like [Hippocampus zosterae]XP_051918821.1 transmembrane protein 272-like [Hippocampus zosterae]